MRKSRLNGFFAAAFFSGGIFFCYFVEAKEKSNITTKIKIVYQKIPYKTIIKEDINLMRWEQKILQQGSFGKMKIKIKYVYNNGKLISKKEIDRVIIRNPKSKIILEGTQWNLASRSYRFDKALIMEARGYDPSYRSCGKSADGITYSGLKAKKGVVAVDPKVIPLKSILYIPSYGYAIAGDIGANIKGNRIDLCFDTYQEAKNLVENKLRFLL